jgi:EpsI family protein
MKSSKVWVLVFCLFATLLVIHARGDVDRVPQSAPLSQLPGTFGPWTSEDIPISPEVLDILGKGDFLNRVYTEGKPEAVGQAATPAFSRPVQLFIAYFATQRSGQSIHSPQNCLPGSGWSFLSSGVTTFSDQTGKQYRVGDYVISNGREKQEVLYWYQSHGRSIASDYKAKLLMLTDAIRYGRTDAALVRVITDVPTNEDPAEAHQRVVNFAKNVTPLLSAYVPN